MNVLHIAASSMQEYLGGGERAAEETARGVGLYVPTTLVTFSLASSNPKEMNQGKFRHLVLPARGTNYANPIPNLRVLSRLIVEHDVIHVHQWHTLILDAAISLKRNGQLLVVSDHGGGGFSMRKLFRRWRAIDILVAQSQLAANNLGFPSDKTVIIPLGIDIQKFRPERGVMRRKGKIVAVGRILPHKGYDKVVSALQQLPEAEFTIIGHPYDPVYLDYLKSQGGDKITFLLAPSDHQLVRELSSASVCVSPSVRNDYKGRFHKVPELFGLSLAEAMACECAVVASDAVPAAVEAYGTIGTSFAGNIVPAGDVDALARALNRWMNGSSYPTNRRYVAQHLDLKIVSQDLVDLYRVRKVAHT